MIVVDNTGVQLLVTNEGMLPFRDPFMPLHRIKNHMHYNSDPCTLGVEECIILQVLKDTTLYDTANMNSLKLAHTFKDFQRKDHTERVH